MKIKTSSARRMALAVLTAGTLAAGVVGASSASATTIKTGYGKISYQGLAVGTNIDAVTGVPGGKASFVWDLTGGVTKVRVTGKFSVIDRSGVPVRLDLYYYDGLNGTGNRVVTSNTAGFTPASDTLVIKNLNWAPPGLIGVQSAKLCVASDADRNNIYTDERCIISSL